MTYDFPMRSGGNLNLRFIGTYLYDMIVDTGLGAAPIDYEGQSGPVASFGSFNTQPKWQAQGVPDVCAQAVHDHVRDAVRRVRHAQRDLVRERARGPLRPRLPFSVSDNSVGDAYYLNWSGSYDFRQGRRQGYADVLGPQQPARQRSRGSRRAATPTRRTRCSSIRSASAFVSAFVSPSDLCLRGAGFLA